MKANGKADLYFHAYFWEKYLKQLSEGSTPSSNGSKSARKKKKILKTQKEDEEADALEDDTVSAGPKEEEVVIPPSSGSDLFSGKYPFMKRLIGLSATLSKVIVNIKKFPFHEKMYHKYAKEFGQR